MYTQVYGGRGVVSLSITLTGSGLLTRPPFPPSSGSAHAWRHHQQVPSAQDAQEGSQGHSRALGALSDGRCVARYVVVVGRAAAEWEGEMERKK